MKFNTFIPKKSRAQAMVEFAIVLPILLMLLYGILEAGRLLFIYSSVVTASRQAARYGSATGAGSQPNTPRYQDCKGIRDAAQKVDFLNSFDNVDIALYHDTGPGSGQTPFCGTQADGTVNGPPTKDPNFDPAGNDERLIVVIKGDFFPIVPKLISFIERSVAKGNPLVGSSARTILTGVTIVVTPPGGGGSPTLELSIDSVSPPTYSYVNDVITFNFTVTNNGTADLTDVTITDSNGKLVSFTCAASLPFTAPDNVATCTATYTITQADIDFGSVTISVTASGPYGAITITSDPPQTATATLIPDPAFTLAKAASQAFATTDNTVVYTYVFTNTGNVTLVSPFIVNDNKIPDAIDCSSSASSLAPGNAFSCTGSYVVKQNDTNAGTLVNLAEATAMYGTQTVTSNQTSATVYTGSLYLSVSASPTSVSQVGQVITYTYTIFNNTGGPLYSPYSISGGRGSDNCSSLASSMNAGGSVTCTGTYTVTQADLDAGVALANNNITAGACAEIDKCNGNNQLTSNTASVSVNVSTSPVLNMQLTASPAIATTLNSPVTYTYVLTNLGNVTLSSPFTITDTKITGITCSGTTLAPISADPNAKITCTKTYNVTQADIDEGSIINQATATAMFGTQTVSASPQSFTVITFSGARLKLTITPNPTTFNGPGQFIIYVYTIKNTGSVPLNGPFVVTDNKVNFVDCGNAATTLAMGATTTCVGSYASTQPDVDGGTITNTASVKSVDGTTSNNATASVSTPWTTPTCTATSVTLTASADAWLNETTPSQNNGTTTTLIVRSRDRQNSSQPYRNARTLVNFTLPSLPPGCLIQSVTLRLNASAFASGRTLQAFQVSSSWTETGVNWTNQPTTTGTAVTTASGSGYIQWSVTTMVQAMMSGTNNGFLIQDASENAGGSGEQQTFISRENSTNTPQLVITYTQAP